jgi:hypothetical protein
MKSLKKLKLSDVAIALAVTAWAVGMVVIICMSIKGEFN